MENEADDRDDYINEKLMRVVSFMEPYLSIPQQSTDRAAMRTQSPIAKSARGSLVPAPVLEPYYVSVRPGLKLDVSKKQRLQLMFPTKQP